MSGEKIDHYTEASKVATEITDGSIYPRAHYVAEAQLHAALALAYEQRTANLIALFTVAEDAVPALHVGGMKDTAWVDAARQIVERLGLA